MRNVRQAVRNEHGAVLVLSVILMVVLLAMAALAIDVGQLYLARQRAQNVCDAAVLAGGKLLTGTDDCTGPGDKPAVAAKDCKDANNTAVTSWQVQGFTVEFPTTVTFDNGTTATCDLGDAIKVTGYVPVNYAFARIFGLVSKDVHASATALLGPAQYIYSTYAVPWAAPIAVLDLGIGETFDVGPVDSWQTGFVGPGNWLALSFGDDTGMPDYLRRLRMESDPVPLSVHDFVGTTTGGAVGTPDPNHPEAGQSKTYDGLIGTFRTNGTVKDYGRILLESDPRFQASHLDADGDGYDEYYRTGYNPDAWDTWEATTNAQGLHPATNRIAVLPVADPGRVSGSSTDVEILGFAAFFIERVWDGITPDSDGVVHPRGDLEGLFIQSVDSGSVDQGWIFEGTESRVKDSVRDVYLIS
jgi:Flp pilus assembly protein TadG